MVCYCCQMNHQHAIRYYTRDDHLQGDVPRPGATLGALAGAGKTRSKIVRDDNERHHIIISSSVIACPHAHALRSELRPMLKLPGEEALINSGPEWLLILGDSILQAGEWIPVSVSAAFLKRYREALLSIRQPTVPDLKGKKPLYPACSRKGATAARTGSRWQAPGSSEIKVNVDGAFSQTGVGAIGVIIRDCQGQPLLALHKWLSLCRDAEEVEALACLEGIKLASRWPHQHVVIESDCETVVKKLLAGGMDRSAIAPTIWDATQELKNLGSFTLIKIGREQNKVAHELAQLAVRTKQCVLSLDSFPDCVVPLLRSEAP